MVKVKEAISNETWLNCEYKDDWEDEIIKFRIKIISFRKLELSEIDDPERVENLDPASILWIMKLEFINLTKKPFHPRCGPPKITLVDQDGFNFYILEDYHLESGSHFSKISGMERFNSADLIPKIKAVGSIIYQLPDDDDAEYMISIKDNGIVQEV